jgi:hypothetical protein
MLMTKLTSRWPMLLASDIVAASKPRTEVECCRISGVLAQRPFIAVAATCLASGLQGIL